MGHIASTSINFSLLRLVSEDCKKRRCKLLKGDPQVWAGALHRLPSPRQGLSQQEGCFALAYREGSTSRAAIVCVFSWQM